MRFVCFLFNFGPDSLKLLGLIIEANFYGSFGYSLFFRLLTGATAVEINFQVDVVQGGLDHIY